MGIIIGSPLVVFIAGVALFKVLWLAIALLVSDGNMAVEFVKSGECLVLKTCLMFLCRNIAKGDKNGVARMIMGFVKRFKLLVTEVGNVSGLTTTIVMIGAGWVQMLAQSLPKR